MVPLLSAIQLFLELWTRALRAQRYVDACRFAVLRALTEVMFPDLAADIVVGFYGQLNAAQPRPDLQAVLDGARELGIVPIDVAELAGSAAALFNVAARGFVEAAAAEPQEARRTVLLRCARELLADCELLLVGSVLVRPETLVGPLDAPEPIRPNTADLLACQRDQQRAQRDLEEAGDRHDSEAADMADRWLGNCTLALELHNGSATARETMRARLAVLRPFLMLRGGTDFLDRCRRAIATERWGELVTAVAELEGDFVSDTTLKWRPLSEGPGAEPTGKQAPLPLPPHFDDAAPLL